jgi:hypothetical protein
MKDGYLIATISSKIRRIGNDFLGFLGLIDRDQDFLNHFFFAVFD